MLSVPSFCLSNQQPVTALYTRRCDDHGGDDDGVSLPHASAGVYLRVQSKSGHHTVACDDDDIGYTRSHVAALSPHNDRPCILPEQYFAAYQAAFRQFRQSARFFFSLLSPFGEGREGVKLL